MTIGLGGWFGSRMKGLLMRSREARPGMSLKALASDLPESTLDDIGLTRAGTMLPHGCAPDETAPSEPFGKLLAMRNPPCHRQREREGRGAAGAPHPAARASEARSAAIPRAPSAISRVTRSA